MKENKRRLIEGMNARRVVGIDMGARSLKLVQIKRGTHGPRIAAVHFVEFPCETATRLTMEARAAALKTFLAENRIRSECYVSSFPLYSAIVRNTVVPFHDRKKIRQVIKFQAEPHIPFPIEEVVIDFHETGPAEDGATPVIIIGIKKTLIGKHLEVMKSAGVDPAMVDIDAFALVNNYQVRCGEKAEGPVALLDIGATKTLLVVMEGPKVLLTRSLNVGGDEITEGIQRELGVEFEEAERMKREAASAASTAGEGNDAGKIRVQVNAMLSKLIREVDRSLRSIAGMLKGTALTALYLSGGGACLGGIREYLAGEFNCPVDLLCRLSPLPGSVDDEIMCRMGVATGLALNGLGYGGAAINLRREEFSYTGMMVRLRRQVVLAAILFLLMLGFLVYGFSTRFFVERSEYLKLRERIEEVYGELFTGEKVDASNVVKKMREKLSAYKEEYESFSLLSETSVSSLEILREVSLLMPAELKAQVTEMAVGQDRVEIEGLIDNPGDADKIKLKLSESEFFTSVDVPSTTQEEEKYQFKLVAELKRGETE